MMSVLFPKTIADAQFTSSNISEPDSGAGEVAWVSGTSYSIGDVVIRTATHRKYECITAVSGTTAPEDDPAHWEDFAPTNKWAWNDLYIDTPSTKASSVVLTVQPGTVTAMDFYGLVGDTLRVQIKDAPGGTTYYDTTYSLFGFAGSDFMWEFYFGEQVRKESFLIDGIYPQPLCEVTVTVEAASGNAAIGRASFGKLESLGMAEQGFVAKPRSFHKIRTDEFGNTTVIPGRKAVDISGSCVISKSEANAVKATITKLLGKPVSWIPSKDTAYDYLKTYGIGEAEISAEGAGHAKVTIKVEGIV
jgi:hypothetical protein